MPKPKYALITLQEALDHIGEESDEDAWCCPKHTPKPSEVQFALAEIAEMQASFDIRWKSDMRAIKQWQDVHPGNDLTWPDHADLVVWLAEQLDALRVVEPANSECRTCGDPVYCSGCFYDDERRD